MGVVAICATETKLGDTPVKGHADRGLLIAQNYKNLTLGDGASNTKHVTHDIDDSILWQEAIFRMFNGITWDRMRNNTEGPLIASGAYTETQNTPDQENHNAKGVYVFFSITAVPGSDTVTLTIEAKDPVAGTYEVLLSGSAEVATGTKCYLVYPSAGAAANGVDAVSVYPLPRTWQVTVTHSGSGEFTYSVGFALIL